MRWPARPRRSFGGDEHAASAGGRSSRVKRPRADHAGEGRPGPRPGAHQEAGASVLRSSFASGRPRYRKRPRAPWRSYARHQGDRGAMCSKAQPPPSGQDGAEPCSPPLAPRPRSRQSTAHAWRPNLHSGPAKHCPALSQATQGPAAQARTPVVLPRLPPVSSFGRSLPPADSQCQNARTPLALSPPTRPARQPTICGQHPGPAEQPPAGPQGKSQTARATRRAWPCSQRPEPGPPARDPEGLAPGCPRPPGKRRAVTIARAELA